MFEDFRAAAETDEVLAGSVAGELIASEVEIRFRRHDGVYRWHLSRASAMRDTTGAIAMWIGSNTDIDDQNQCEFWKSVMGQ